MYLNLYINRITDLCRKYSVPARGGANTKHASCNCKNRFPDAKNDSAAGRSIIWIQRQSLTTSERIMYYNV
jgi:hypothetical protein